MRFYVLIFILFIFQANFGQSAFNKQLAICAEELTNESVIYNPAYFTIAYPNGDVPKEYGVCTDVVIRALRKMNIDLQKEVHLDMKQNFSLYPKKWGLTKPDTNIDHRRVPNLMTYFKRQGYELPITENAENYLPGDIVAWNLGGAITHIGVVSSKRNISNQRCLVVHNIGAGQVLEDMFFNFKIIGHYRYKD
jgi:uncharacterized protein YijF (DUF1287 family)